MATGDVSRRVRANPSHDHKLNNRFLAGCHLSHLSPTSNWPRVGKKVLLSVHDHWARFGGNTALFISLTFDTFQLTSDVRQMTTTGKLVNGNTALGHEWFRCANTH